ncbi:hypothetical protein DFH07DRAFT_766903 [Mycena maculata]|uniref:C2H2-type domain-containing protein n=1 Tax=Mycena maculata TaxID=230809 RepID=A0AAD7K2Y5_9AGAR|nr:hypothetical protein DFH07DRAFT_766903 [Mycena maculata]
MIISRGCSGAQSAVRVDRVTTHEIEREDPVLDENGNEDVAGGRMRTISTRGAGQPECNLGGGNRSVGDDCIRTGGARDTKKDSLASAGLDSGGKRAIGTRGPESLRFPIAECLARRAHRKDGNQPGHVLMSRSPPSPRELASAARYKVTGVIGYDADARAAIQLGCRRQMGTGLPPVRCTITMATHDSYFSCSLCADTFGGEWAPRVEDSRYTASSRRARVLEESIGISSAREKRYVGQRVVCGRHRTPGWARFDCSECCVFVSMPLDEGAHGEAHT